MCLNMLFIYIRINFMCAQFSIITVVTVLSGFSYNKGKLVIVHVHFIDPFASFPNLFQPKYLTARSTITAAALFHEIESCVSS